MDETKLVKFLPSIVIGLLAVALLFIGLAIYSKPKPAPVVAPVQKIEAPKAEVPKNYGPSKPKHDKDRKDHRRDR